MSVLHLLSSASGKKDNEANISLAKEIASSKNKDAVKELISNLNNKDSKIQSDCIKVLYETGYIRPELIAPFYKEFMEMLVNKNNRMVWGAMIALSTIVNLKHKEVFNALDLIMQTVDKGSVITIDCGVMILAELNKFEDYYNSTNPLLLEQLKKCPVKQLPMYAEKSLVSISEKNKTEFTGIIEKRLTECDKDSQKKRLLKILEKLS